MKRNTKKVSQLISQTIKKLDQNAEIILFGSRARGDERKDSDWDVLILTDKDLDYRLETSFRDSLYNLELETGEPLSFFFYSKNDWFTKQKISPFFKNVTAEGIRI
jgi:uncharacterized protein